MAAVTAVVAGAAVVSAGVGMYQSNQANQMAEANMKTQAGIAAENLRFQKEQQRKLDLQKEEYKKVEFKNPYENMENAFEDLTVNQQQAQFEAQQGAQQRSNIMESMKSAAGGSGIAGLAQAMANQGQLASQRASVSIGMQEQANQAAAIGQEQKNIELFRAGEDTMAQREMQRQSTLLGMEMGEMSGARAATQQAQANQMAAGAAAVQAKSAQASASMSMATNLAGTAGGMYQSDAQARAAAKDPTASCFVENSKVLMKDGTLKNIQDIQTGDEVRSINGSSAVKKLITHEINDVYRIYTNGPVNTTADHPLHMDGKWTNAEKLGWDSELTYVDKLYNVLTNEAFIVDGVVATGLQELELKEI
jgi:hypothetical protein